MKVTQSHAILRSSKVRPPHPLQDLSILPPPRPQSGAALVRSKVTHDWLSTARFRKDYFSKKLLFNKSYSDVSSTWLLSFRISITFENLIDLIMFKIKKYLFSLSFRPLFVILLMCVLITIYQTHLYTNFFYIQKKTNHTIIKYILLLDRRHEEYLFYFCTIYDK